MEYILHGLYGHLVQSNVEEGESYAPGAALTLNQCMGAESVRDLLVTYLQNVIMPFAEVRT